METETWTDTNQTKKSKTKSHVPDVGGIYTLSPFPINRYNNIYVYTTLIHAMLWYACPNTYLMMGFTGSPVHDNITT